jgi:uncharacterized protein (DUF2141 family)
MRLLSCLQLRRLGRARAPLAERRSPIIDPIRRKAPDVRRRRGARLALAPAAALALVLGGAAQAVGAPIVVKVSEVKSDRGSVRVDVCTRETFLHTTCPYSGAAPASMGETTVTVPDVPPGVYAIQAYHDLDDDREVDQGPLGIPREGLGFSREPRLGLHGPSFEAAAITHEDELQTLHLRLRFEPRPQLAKGGSGSTPPPRPSRSARREPAAE